MGGNRIYINGKDVTADVTDGLENITIAAGLNPSTRTVGKILSTDITFIGETYKYLRNRYFGGCDDWQNKDKAKLKTDICGGITIECAITSTDMQWDSINKKISVPVKSEDEISEAYARLDSEYVTENGFRDNVEIPIMYFADQPNWIQWALILFTIQIRFILNLIDSALNTICSIVLFGKDCGINLSGLLFSALDTWITGVGRWAPAPLIREMIEYQCNVVGLKFVSSILNNSASQYYNTCMVCLTAGVHGDYKDTSRVTRIKRLEDNSPTETTISLLDRLSTAFNADFRIIGDTLYFERLDFFFDLATKTLVDLSKECTEEPVTVSYNINNLIAYGEYAFTMDAFDAEGNKVLRRDYKDKYEYNLPYNPAQKGKKVRSINFGASRFMFDEYLFGKNGFFNFEKLIDEFRDGPENFIDENLLALDNLRRKNDLILGSSILTTEKLIVLEPNFSRNDAKAIRKKIGEKDGKAYYRYNYPLHIDELYKNFLYLDNPRIRRDKYSISDITIECNCDAVDMVLNDFNSLKISHPEVSKIIPGTVSIEFKENEKVKITISDCIGLCD
jgi:hypothetical protein